MAAPRSADNDEFRVSERDDGGEDPAYRLAESLTRGRLWARIGCCGQEPVHVDGRRIGLPEAELAEYLDERNRLALRASRDKVRNLAGEAGMAAPYLTIADDRAAQSLAQEEVGEVVQGGTDLTLTLGKPQLLGMLAGKGLEGIQTEGDPGVLQRLLGLLDTPDPGFAIVTP